MEYAKNPLVLDVHLDSVESVCSSRHFMGFGFSKHVPYYFPGTIMSFPSTSSQGRRVMVTGMLTACGQRSKEFAVLISFDQPIWTDEASAMFPGFNMTEIEDEDSACQSLVELIWRYNCTMGDLEPCLLGTDLLQRSMVAKFANEILRLREAVEVVLVSDQVQSHKGAAEAIEEDFSCFRSSLFIVMRCNPLGTREWLQHFEMYMSCAAARRGIGFIEFCLY